MRRLASPIVIAGALVALSVAPSPLSAQSGSLPEGCTIGRAPAGSRVLVYSHTTGYRHASIPAAARAIKSLGAEFGFAVEHTEDSSRFTDENLKRFAAVVFLSNTQRVLDSAGRAAFQRYVRSGGGYVGIHASSNAELDWPWYGDLMGARFRQHPKVQAGVVSVADSTHLSTRCLPAKWNRPDEWYNFKTPPIQGARVLLTIDEKSYEGGTMGADHPLAWYHEFDGGRAWYTALGHFDEHYTDPVYRSHILGGILWAMKK
jgi:type 1 glutamine amidotransferase